ncbi:hypothetical protein [Hymenobacter translucens]|uniref:hypothetical protein n=1 Tax=Hymenobacter translucens TaxID=2886507 RepID=UPI001D0DDBED|nr:hypothetical protein [Hymenobacter translucens]
MLILDSCSSSSMGYHGRRHKSRASKHRIQSHRKHRRASAFQWEQRRLPVAYEAVRIIAHA